MNVNDLSVTIPVKEGMGEPQVDVLVWPLIENALEAVGAEEITIDAASKAIFSSDGCAALANFLMLEGSTVHKMDLSYKVPLLVLAARHTEEDDATDIILDDTNRILFLETDSHQFAIPIMKDWQVDWPGICHEVVDSFDAEPDMERSWALDHLLEYAEVAIDEYLRPEDDL